MKTVGDYKVWESCDYWTKKKANSQADGGKEMPLIEETKVWFSDIDV